MTLIEKKLKFLNNDDGLHTPKIGRYSASSLYSIIAGYKKPEDFFKPDPIKEAHADIVLRGMMAEDMLAKILKDTGCKCGDDQSKYEVKIDDEIVIVCKPDFEWKTEVWECKYPREMVYEIPRKWKYQLEVESRATNKPVKLMVFSEPFNLTEIEYIPSDETWNEIVKKIKLYHNKIKKLYDNKNI